MLDLKALLSKILTMLTVEDISDKITFGGAWTGLQRVAYRIGNMVFFSLEGYAGTIVGGSQYTIATIASGYRPKSNVILTAHSTNIGYVPQAVVNAWVWTSGDVTVRPSNGSGNYIFVSGCYAI